MRRRVRGGSSISFKFLLPPKIAATASRPSPITHALRAITKSVKRGAKRNAIRLNNNTERIRFVPASPPPILLRLALHRGRIRRDPRVNSDTSHMAGNRHTEEKYEHTNRSCNRKTPVWVPGLRTGLGSGGGGGPCGFRALVQSERLYSGPLLSLAI